MHSLSSHTYLKHVEKSEMFNARVTCLPQCVSSAAERHLVA